MRKVQWNDFALKEAVMAFDRDWARANRWKIYETLTNNEWVNAKGEHGGLTWRGCGGVLADLIGEGEDYLDYYCHGDEGRVDPDVRIALSNAGWELVGE